MVVMLYCRGCGGWMGYTNKAARSFCSAACLYIRGPLSATACRDRWIAYIYDSQIPTLKLAELFQARRETIFKILRDKGVDLRAKKRYT